MHRLTLGKGNKVINIDIEHLKFLIGDDDIFKYEILFILKNYFEKVKSSEYAIESENTINLYFDGKPLVFKDWCFYEVTPFYDLGNDLKLGSKSLFAKYLDTFKTELEYSETFTTLSIIIDSLNDDFFRAKTPLKINDKRISLKLDQITNEYILKHCVVSILEDECDCNVADVTMEEVILAQLKLIDKISSFEKEKYHLVYCYIPVFTESLKKFLLEIKKDNLFLIINSLNTISNSLFDNYICSKRKIDLANDDQYLETIMELPFFIELDDLKKQIKEQLDCSKHKFKTPVGIEFMPWKFYN